MTVINEPPKVFISYSWSGPEHEKFVLELATALRDHGVDAILDKWKLKPGQDKFVFMESMVTDKNVQKVLVLCDQQYKAKADDRSGGVGTESQIISSELYTKVNQTKFIPVICERGDDGQEFLPIFMTGRMYVDMSADEKWGEGLDQLLRQIYDQPLYPEPSLGEVPSFLKPEGTGMPMAKEMASTLRAIRESKASRAGLETLFLQSIFAEIERQYVRPNGGEGYDEEICQAIQNTKGLRDQMAEYINTVTIFSTDTPKELKPFISLLERLGKLFGPPITSGTYCPGWADIYRFFALELVLIAVATLLNHECWQMLKHFLKYPFIVHTDNPEHNLIGILAFDSEIVSIDEHRKFRLRLNRPSPTADLLKERCSPEHLTFGELVQADIFLALYGALHINSPNVFGGYPIWVPRTTVYSSAAKSLPVFLKVVDPDFRNNIRGALGISSAADMAKRIDDARSKLQNFGALTLGNRSAFNFENAVNLKALTE